MARLIKDDRTLTRARKLRRGMSDEERVLWMLLRDRRFADFKFRRQVRLAITSWISFVSMRSWCWSWTDHSTLSRSKQRSTQNERACWKPLGFASRAFGVVICSRTANAQWS